MQWTLTQILVACAFPTLHFSVTWHPSEDVRYTLSFQPQELHRCTNGTFHWALQQGKDMRCLGGGVRFRNVLWHIICQSLSVSASACSRALFEVETPVETACALFMNYRCVNVYAWACVILPGHVLHVSAGCGPLLVLTASIQTTFDSPSLCVHSISPKRSSSTSVPI